MMQFLVTCFSAIAAVEILSFWGVFSVKPPSNGAEYYVHRSGRTGRAGREGVAIMLHSGSAVERSVLKEVRLSSFFEASNNLTSEKTSGACQVIGQICEHDTQGSAFCVVFRLHEAESEAAK